MSGAEFILVLGVAASAIQVWESCVKIAKFIRDCDQKGILENLEPQINLLAFDIEQLQNLNLDLPPENWLGAVLRGCQRELIKLFTLIEEYHKSYNTSRSRRFLQAASVPKREKEIQKKWAIICEYRSSITLHLSMQSANKLLVASIQIPNDSSLFLLPWKEPSPHPVGRQNVFDKITHSINQSTKHPCIIFLTGHVGIGKTQIAMEFCYRVRQQYSMIAWIAAANESSITHSILHIANALSGDKQAFTSRDEGLKLIQELSRKRRRPWLFVIDNNDNTTLDSDLFCFPKTGQQCDVVVITQRARTSSGLQIEVPPLTEDDAVQLLLRNSILSSRHNGLEAEKEIAKKLGYLPLALAMAGHMLKERGMTAQEYLQAFHEEETKLESPALLTTLLRLSFDNLRSQDHDVFDFLLQLSTMGPTTECTFHDFYLISQAHGDSRPSYYKLFILDGQWSSELFLEIVMRISALGIITKEMESDTGLVIRITHLKIQEELQKDMVRDKRHHLQLISQATATVVAPLATHDWEAFSLGCRKILLENAMQIIQQQNSIVRSPEQVREFSGILEGRQTMIAAFLGYHGREKLARDLLLESLQLQSAWLGESAALTCKTMTCLILLEVESINLDAAEIFLKRLTVVESQGYGTNHFPCVDRLLLSGQLQMWRKNHQDALIIFKECTDLHVTMNGLSHIGAASSLVSGAEALLLQGELEEATQNIYDADCIVKLAGGMRSLEIRIKWNFARLSACRGDYVRAIRRYEDLIEEQRKNLGTDYKRLRTLHCELGDVYRDLGDMQKAENYYKAGFAIASRKTRSLTDTDNVSAWLVYGSLTKDLIPH